MNYKSYTQTIRGLNQPYYLEEQSNRHGFSAYSARRVIQEFKDLFISDITLQSTGNIYCDSPKVSLPPKRTFMSEIAPSDRFAMAPRLYFSCLGRVLQEYMTDTSMTNITQNTKIKCSSVDGRTTKDMSTSYRHEYTIIERKVICDMNLWRLLESLKQLYSSQDSSATQPIIINIAKLIMAFILSSISKLQKKKCKHILESLDELEEAIYAQLQISSSPSKFSPNISSNSHFSSPKVNSDSNNSSSTKPSGRRESRLFSKSNSLVLGTFSVMDNTPKLRSNPAESIKRATMNSKSAGLVYKEILKVLAKTKYTVAQLGHQLHYLQIIAAVKNPFADQTQGKMKNEYTIYQDEQSENLINYNFRMQNLLGDNNDVVLAKRVDQLKNFWSWKIKKWAKQIEREKIENKYKNHELTCKICEQDIKMEKFKRHIDLCKRKAELTKQVRDIDTKISDTILQAFIQAKTIQMNLIVDDKKCKKLKKEVIKSQETSNPILSSEQSKCLKLIFTNREKENITPITTTANLPVRSDRLLKRSFTASKPNMRRFSFQPENKLLLRARLKKSEKLEEETPEADPTPTITSILDRKLLSPTSKEDSNINSERSCDNSSVISSECNDELDELFVPNPAKDILEEQVNNGDIDDTPDVHDSESHLLKKKPLDVGKELLTLHLDEATKMKKGPMFQDRRMSFESEKEWEIKSAGDFTNIGHSCMKGISDSSSKSDSSATDSLSEKSPTVTSSADNKGFLPQYRKSKFYTDKVITESPDMLPENIKGESEGEKETAEDEGIELERKKRFKRFAEESDTFEKPVGTLRRTKTGLQGNDTRKEDQEEHAAKIIEQIRGLGETIDSRMQEIQVYKTIRERAKTMLNQDPYAREMDIVKEDLFETINYILDQVKNQKVHKFAGDFLNILDERISVGKELDDTQKSIYLLKGKLSEDITTKLPKYSLIREKSSLALPSKSSKLSNINKRAPESTLSAEKNTSKSTLSNSNTNDKNLQPNDKPAKQPSDFEKLTHLNNFQEYLKEVLKDSEDNVKNAIKVTQTTNPISNTDHQITDNENLTREDSAKEIHLQTIGLNKLKKKKDDISLANIIRAHRANQAADKSAVVNLSDGTDHIPTPPQFMIRFNTDSPTKACRKVQTEDSPLELLRETEVDSPPVKLNRAMLPKQKSFTLPPKSPYKMVRKLCTLVTQPSNASKNSSNSRGRTKKSGGEPRVSPQPLKGIYKTSIVHMSDFSGESEDESQLIKSRNVYNFDEDDGDENAVGVQESLSSIGSIVFDKGYFSDSHAKNTSEVVKAQPVVEMKDFEPLKLISKGAFGRVWLVRKKATKGLYAMKVINLAEKLIKNQELDALRNENKALGLAQEDFVVRAVFTFTHGTCICFVMEYMLGGDLGDFLFNYCALEEDVARFYVAEIIVAVEYLHSLGIVHRDLKPDNILLDKRGHAKLTDFGLSDAGLSQKFKERADVLEGKTSDIYMKRLEAINLLCVNADEIEDHVNPKVKGKRIIRKDMSQSRDSDEETDGKGSTSVKRKAHRLIGTPDYMAPEIIKHISVKNYSIDWWSLGVMLFEFLVGIPPFNDDNPEKIYDNIVNLRVPWDEIEVGNGEGCMTAEAVDLIKKLLVIDHTKRLGANGADEIKNHPFFKGINWDKLRESQAPITFEDCKETDTQNFVRNNAKINEKEKEDPFITIPRDGKGGEENMHAVKKFLETASTNFNVFNFLALHSENLKKSEEAQREKEKELKKFGKVDEKVIPQKFRDVFELPDVNM